MVDPEGYSLVTKPLDSCLTLVCVAVLLIAAGIVAGYFLFRHG